MSGQSAPLQVEFPPTPTHPLVRPDARAVDSADSVHRIGEPDGARCSCGRTREACVRDVVRRLWTAQAPADIVDRGPDNRAPTWEGSGR
jgi:hypothetical protein